MFKLQKIFILLFFALTINTLNAQESKNSSFMIMSSNGYMQHEPRLRGSGHINTFLYCPNKIFAFGIDLGISRCQEEISLTRILNISLSPCVYSFIVNSKKHQVYLGASMGVGYTGMKLYAMYYAMGFTFASNIGYNYIIKRNWMIGARAYSNYNLFYVEPESRYHSSIMGLVTIGYRF